VNKKLKRDRNFCCKIFPSICSQNKNPRKLCQFDTSSHSLETPPSILNHWEKQGKEEIFIKYFLKVYLVKLQRILLSIEWLNFQEQRPKARLSIRIPQSFFPIKQNTLKFMSEAVIKSFLVSDIQVK